jgi:DNA-binding Xre family transcriptional regulator
VRKDTIDKRLLEMYKIVSDNIVQRRGKMSQDELAKKAGLSREVISAIENKKSIHFDSLLKIAWALNIHPGDLLRSREDEKNFFDHLETLIEIKVQEEVKKQLK